MARLKTFIATGGVAPAVLAQAEMFHAAIEKSAAYLRDTRHKIALIGSIRVGKTLALCFIANLLLKSGGKEPLTLKQRAVLEVGQGWITICDVHVSTKGDGNGAGGRFTIVIQPNSDDEVFRLTSDLCTSFCAMRDGQEKENRVPEEIERALRSMANLTRKPVKRPDGTVESTDPLLELSKSYTTPEALTAEVFAQIKIQERTLTEIWYDAPTLEEGLAWLQETYRQVNNGRHKQVSLPQRIDIHVPFPVLDGCELEVSFNDTKGVDGTAIRPDLQAHIDDPRTLPVLCSQFAPDPAILGLFDHLVDTGRAAAAADRLVLLVLPRPGEAKDLTSEDGAQVSSDAEGYVIRSSQIRSKLSHFPGAQSLPIQFFNASSDDPADAAARLKARLQSLREGHAKRLRDVTAATEELLANHKKKQVIAGLAKVNNRITAVLAAHRELPARTGPVHAKLLEAIDSSHARTVWATTRRNGSWRNLNSYHWVGVGTNLDAKTRSDGVLSALDAEITALLADPECVIVTKNLEELRKKVADSRLQFLDEVTNRSKEIFRAVLFPDDPHWGTCKAYWDEGRWFRSKVTSKVREWCEHPDHKWIHEAVEGITVKDWQEFFLAPLLVVCAAPAPAPPPTPEPPKP